MVEVKIEVFGQTTYLQRIFVDSFLIPNARKLEERLAKSGETIQSYIVGGSRDARVRLSLLGFPIFANILNFSWLVQVYLPEREKEKESLPCSWSQRQKIEEADARGREAVTVSGERADTGCPFDGYGQLCNKDCAGDVPLDCPGCNR